MPNKFEIMESITQKEFLRVYTDRNGKLTQDEAIDYITEWASANSVLFDQCSGTWHGDASHALLTKYRLVLVVSDNVTGYCHDIILETPGFHVIHIDCYSALA